MSLDRNGYHRISNEWTKCPICGANLKNWAEAFANDLDKGKHICPTDKHIPLDKQVKRG